MRQSDPGAEVLFSEDAAATAQHWAGQGAEWLHIVNLDGPLGATVAHLDALHRPDSTHFQHPLSDAAESARSELRRTLPVNLRRLLEIRQAVAVPIQFGGGVRTLDDIRLALELGADRVVLDTVAIENPSLVAEAIEAWGAERIVVGIDALDGKVATHGRQVTNNVDVIDFGHQMQAIGVKRVIYTDISPDGLLNGVDVEATARLGEVCDLRVITRGGIADLEEMERLKAHEHFNIEGLITGQGIGAGALDLAAAIEIGHRPLEHFSAGVIPVRMGEDGFEFLLLYNWYYELWEFPRGPIEPREATVEGARRAFSELTGLQIRRFSGGCNPRLNYMVVIRDYEIRHTVVYHLAEVDDGEVQIGNENHCEAHWGDYRSTWELLTETAPEQLPALDRAMVCLQERLDS